MKFTPKSEKELAEEKVIPAGEYDGEVIGAEETVSKTSGKPMIKVRVKVHGPRKVIIDDYFVCDQYEKLLNLCTALGIPEKYHNGTLEPLDLHGKGCLVKVKIDPPKGDFPTKNSIRSYGSHKVDKAKELVSVGEAINKARAEEAGGDDIPF